MDIRKKKLTPNTRKRGGFSAIELLITATILTIVTGVGVMGISQARASIRLSGAAREYATYIEKARMFSIRSHADDAGERATLTINEDLTSYEVTMDLDGDGDLETRTITLPDGVKFDNAETIAFDWRGRTWNTANGVTRSNAQVSIRLVSGDNAVSIDVTGSGDITVDSEVFDDNLPEIKLHVSDLSAGPNSTPAPTPVTETATPTPTPLGTPDDRLNPTPTPTPTPSGGSGSGSGNSGSGSSGSGSSGSGSGNSGSGGNGNSGNGNAQPTPTPTPNPVPTPTPVPAVCTLSVNLPKLVLLKDRTGSISVKHDAGATLIISANSSKASDLQVAPNSQSVAGGSSANFQIKSKKTLGTYSVTFSTSCGSKTVTVLVVASLLGISL